MNALCPEIAAATEKQLASFIARFEAIKPFLENYVCDELPRTTTIYAFQRQDGLTKIGRTKALEQRKSSISQSYKRVGDPSHKLELCHSLRVNRILDSIAEKHIQSLFSKQKVRGEWFDLREVAPEEVERAFSDVTYHGLIFLNHDLWRPVADFHFLGQLSGNMQSAFDFWVGRTEADLSKIERWVASNVSHAIGKLSPVARQLTA